MASGASPSNSIPTDYWSRLEQIYHHNNQESEWQIEKPRFQQFLPLIINTIATQYALEGPIKCGGAGVVSKIIDINLTSLQENSNHPVCRAMKFPRPTKGSEEVLSESLIKEFRTLASLTHTNVIKLYYASSVKTPDGIEYPFYIMDYIEDATSPNDYLKRPTTTFADFLRILKDMTTGIAFLFNQDIAHNDIKPSNVLIDGNRGIINDLGSALSLKNTADAVITFTRRYAHPEKLANSVSTKDSNRYRRQAPDPTQLMVWDIYSLGCSVLEMLDDFSKSHPHGITAYQYRYLKLMASRMLDNRRPDDFAFYEFPRNFYDETKYVHVEPILVDLTKLTGEYSLSDAVPELNFHANSNIQVGMHGPTPTSKELLEVLGHPVLRRLSSISQLGLIVYLYPGATHTRQEHSLGVYSNAVRMVDALWHDAGNPMFRQVMDREDLTACLMTALLHDIGQYPLAHDLEEADEKFFNHEEIGHTFFRKPLDGRKSIADLLDECWPAKGGDSKMSDRVFRILKQDKDSTLKNRILHSIIDGPIDADKLDYLPRDGRKLNVPYGSAIDFERLMKVSTIVHKGEGNMLNAALGVHENGKISAEAVGFARYSMFGAIYWHRTSRAVKAMLHHATWDMLVNVKPNIPPDADHEEIDRAVRQAKNVIREQFRNLVLENAFPPIQQRLFSEQNSEMAGPMWPGINHTDLQIIRWLWQRCGPQAQKLLENLSRRDLYKRVLTISKEKRGDIWKKAHEFSAGATPTDRLQLDKRVHQEVVRYLIDLPDSKKKMTMSLSNEAISEMNILAGEQIPLIVDIPTGRISGARELQYFPENDRWKHSADHYVDIGDETSKIWAGLFENFGTSIGKIRIFAHAKITETIRSIAQKELENCLLTALDRL